MILYTGGIYQGKLDAAVKKLNTDYEAVFDCSKIEKDIENISFDETDKIKIVYKVEELVRLMLYKKLQATSEDKCIEQYLDTEASKCKWIKEYILAFIKKINPEVIVITEVGAGIISLDKNENLFREITGDISVELAKISDSVIRVICGIEQKIK